ncbi:MAG TPA: hypothetical protein VK702_02895 [Candidatus Acidoferrum sp.]|nr:hypothetical protein [Candidatus Acidoferrum sp.]
MQRWETWTSLAAVVVASVAAFPVPGRLWYSGIAIALLAIVAGAHVHRSLTGQRPTQSGVSPEELARRIREQRNRR